MGNFYEDVKRYRKEILLGTIAILLFLLIKFVIVYIMPFILAGIFVFLIHKPIDLIYEKTKISKSFLAGLLMLSLILLLGAGLWYASGYSIGKLKYLISNLSLYKDQFSELVHSCGDAMEQNLGINSITVQNLILDRVNIFVDDLKIDIVPKVLDNTLIYGKWVLNIVMFILVTIIAVVLLAKDYHKILSKTAHIPIFREIFRMLQKLVHLIGAYLRAQIEILLVISLLCFFGFTISGYAYPYIWGLATGLLDVLPFIGTGVVLLPMAILQFLMGNEVNALVLFITFIVCALSREILEPKLIGAKMGVLPIVILISVYVGIKVFGAGGVIWGPLYMLILYEIYKRLYYTEEEKL